MVFRKLVLELNSLRTRLRRRRFRPENVLLLLPHCLRRSTCGQDVVADPDNCGHCGQCNVDGLLKLRDETGVRFRMASGGRQAVDYVRDPAVKLVVAVACEKELVEGILSAFPKPVIAVQNEQPEGPCRNTRVDPEIVRKALRSAIGQGTPIPGTCPPSP